MVSMASNQYIIDLLHIVWINSVAESLCSLNLAVLVVKSSARAYIFLILPGSKTSMCLTWMSGSHTLKRKIKKKWQSYFGGGGGRQKILTRHAVNGVIYSAYYKVTHIKNYDIKFNHCIHSFFFLHFTASCETIFINLHIFLSLYCCSLSVVGWRLSCSYR